PCTNKFTVNRLLNYLPFTVHREPFTEKNKTKKNMKAESFEDLEVWKEGMRLTVEVYNLLKECRDYGLRDQMQRAAVSVPSNIAEGFERQTNKEFAQFLYIARGSAAELRTQIYLAIQLNVIDKKVGMELVDKTKKIASMLYRLIQARKTSTF
ncbi:MAG: four helix bundle protein, partial [Bacteroidota bacterium]